MALYFGSEKVEIHLNGVLYDLNSFFKTPTLNGVLLLSSDDYIIKDVNGLYLTAKEEEL